MKSKELYAISDLRRTVLELERLGEETPELVRARRECRRLERYIDRIPDDLTRRIFRLRFEERRSWGEVAKRIGGGNKADGVKVICYRYLRQKNNKKSAKNRGKRVV